MSEPEKLKLGSVAAIRRYFEKDGGRKVGLSELQALSHEEKQELGALACKELGAEFVPHTPSTDK